MHRAFQFDQSVTSTGLLQCHELATLQYCTDGTLLEVHGRKYNMLPIQQAGSIQGQVNMCKSTFSSTGHRLLKQKHLLNVRV